MKHILSFSFLFLLLLAALILQDTLSGASAFYQAHFFLLPIVFCFGVLIFSFPVALLFGLITGLMEGLMTLQFQHDRPEIGLGWFLFFFMIWSILLQLASNFTDGIRWELHAVGSALCTTTFLLGEFLLLSWGRGHFSITGATFLLIAIPSAITLFLAPLLYSLLQFLLPPSLPLRSSKQRL